MNELLVIKWSIDGVLHIEITNEVQSVNSGILKSAILVRMSVEIITSRILHNLFRRIKNLIEHQRVVYWSFDQIPMSWSLVRSDPSSKSTI